MWSRWDSVPAWAGLAGVVRYLQEEGIPYELTDMGTLIHGDARRLLKVARALHELPFDQGVNRVVTHISMTTAGTKRYY